MESAAVEALMRRWVEEVWNQKRPERIDEMLTPDTLAHGIGPNGTALRGPAAFEAAYYQLVGIFPDIHVTVDRFLACGDMGAVVLICTGTHLGDGLGIPATGRTVKFTAMAMARCRDGRIMEAWNVLDLLSALRQTSGTEIGDSLP